MELPLKSRLEVVDTTLQRQLELKVLKLLGLVLLFTLLYQHQNIFVPQHVEQVEDVTTTDQEAAKHVTSDQLQSLVEILDKAIAKEPMLRFALQKSLEELNTRRTNLLAKDTSGEDPDVLEPLLSRIEHYLDQNIWKEQAVLQAVLGELAEFRKTLHLAPPEPRGVPKLRIGPKQMVDWGAPARNLFAFDGE